MKHKLSALYDIMKMRTRSRGLRDILSPIFLCYGIAFLVFLMMVILPGKNPTVHVMSLKELDREVITEAVEIHPKIGCDRHLDVIKETVRRFLLSGLSRANMTEQVESFLIGESENPPAEPETAPKGGEGVKDTEPETEPGPEDAEEDPPAEVSKIKPDTNVTSLVRPLCVHWYKGSKNLVSSSNLKMGDLPNNDPVLVIFTTLKNLNHRRIIHENTIRNWAKLKPHIIPVLYNDSTDPALLKIAEEVGWEIFPVPAYGSTGVPKLKDMFKFAKSRFNATFYGYSNGDILYDEGLVQSLHLVKNTLPKIKRAMVMGTRYNVKLGSLAVSDPKDVLKLMPRTGKPTVWAIDFFLIANCDFPWHRVPDDIVIGRPGYDNFFVGVANQYHVPVIDASCTLSAVHQMGPEGRSAGFKNKDKGVNRQLIGKFNWGLGTISRATFETGYHGQSDNDFIDLLQRTRYKNVPKF